MSGQTRALRTKARTNELKAVKKRIIFFPKVEEMIIEERNYGPSKRERKLPIFQKRNYFFFSIRARPGQASPGQPRPGRQNEKKN